MVTDDAKRFVFVLGAGSSKDFEFPLGSELTAKISSALDFRSDNRNVVYGGDDVVRNAFFNGFHQHPSWLDKSKLISSAMPLAPSIDNFVNVHRNDNTIAYCAKIAITACILNAERASSVYVKPDNIYNTINFRKNSSTWHTLFFRIVTMYSTVEQLVDQLKKIAIITFNYDRSFEHFLFHAIKEYYRISNEDAAQIVNSLEIYHPYGKVGRLPYLESGAVVGFGEEVNAITLADISKQIRTFTEGVDPGASDIEKIRYTVFNARSLVFLGFAFHPLNVDLLFGKRKNDGYKNYEKKIFGTAVGSSSNDLNIVSWDLSNKFHCTQEAVQLRVDLTCDKLLGEYSRTLSLQD